MKQTKLILTMLLAGVLLPTGVLAQTTTVTSTFNDMTEPYDYEGDTNIYGSLTTSEGNDWGYAIGDRVLWLSKTTSSGSFALNLKGRPITLTSNFEMTGYVKKITVKVGGSVSKIDYSIEDYKSNYQIGSHEVNSGNVAYYSYIMSEGAGDDSYVNKDNYRCVHITITPKSDDEPTIIESISVEYLKELADDGCSGAINAWLTWKYEQQGYDKVLTISGNGNMRNYEVSGRYTTSPWGKISDITKVVLDEGVGSVGDFAFYNITYLNSVTLPTSSLWSIGKYAFMRNYYLKSITLPEGLQQLGDQAFNGNSSLESVSLPSTLRVLGSQVFGQCPQLASITVAEGNTWYDSRDNCNAVIKTADKELVVGCKNTVIPDGILTIAPYAFYNSNQMESMAIPASVTRIGEHAFDFCNKMTAPLVLEGVQVFEPWAFYYCSSVEFMSLGSNLTLIGKGAFNNMKSLKHVYCTADPGNVTWEYNNDNSCCNPDGSTKFHVNDPAAWKAKFPDAHVQFVEMGSAESSEGDVSGDGKTDADDVTALMNYLMGTPPAGFNAAAADVNNDGKVNVADIVALVNLLLRK